MANAERPGDASAARPPQSRADDTEPDGDARPENVSVAALREYLTEVEGKTATKRIMVGINHKEGVPQTELADWYDVSRTTIHNWLTRLERLADEPLEDVVYDDDRPGRPSKLTPSQENQLEEVLSKPPAEAGYEAPEWTPKLTRMYIKEMFHVEYTLSYVRELLHEAGVSWDTETDQTPDHVQEAFKRGFESEADGHQWMHGCRR
jgi:transposase